MKPIDGITAALAVSALLAGTALAQNSQQAPNPQERGTTNMQPTPPAQVPNFQTGTGAPSNAPIGAAEFGVQTKSNATAASTGPQVKAPDYVRQTAMTDLFEIRAGELAREKATTPAIRSFAQRMINEHTASSKKLTKVVQSENANLAPPGRLDRQHWVLLSDLQRTSGTSFDRDYLKMQANGHQQALALQEDYSRNGEDPKLKQMASEETNVVKSHLDELKQIDPLIASQ